MTGPRRPLPPPASPAPDRQGAPDAPGAPSDLEAALADLRSAVAFPPTPDLARAVRARLAAEPARAPRTGRSPIPSRLPLRVALAGLALLVVLGATLGLSRNFRSAVADRLGIAGIRIELVDETPIPATEPSSGPPASPVGAALLLGDPTTLAAARTMIPYAIRLPAALGPPDEVYVRPISEGSMVAVLYRPRPGLPAAAETGVGALLMQFPAGADSADIAKKVLWGQGDLTEVIVGDEFGYWITGASELILLPDPAAGVADDPGRPSANVLLWAADGVTYRLETALPLPDALAIATSLAAPTEEPPSMP